MIALTHPTAVEVTTGSMVCGELPFPLFLVFHTKEIFEEVRTDTVNQRSKY